MQILNALSEPGIEPRTFCTAVRRVTSRPPSQQKVSITVTLFNSFKVMGGNINK